MPAATKAILLPGNGCPGNGASLTNVMWYGWIAAELKKHFDIECNPIGFPYPLEAFEHAWKEFAVKELGLDENTLIIGHSSGAACALRLMEEHKTAGCILVSAYDSDLGDELERESGYFDRPFNYEQMVANTPFILQFHAVNDPLVPFSSGLRVAEGTKSEFVKSPNDGHFNEKTRYPVFIEKLVPHLKPQ